MASSLSGSNPSRRWRSRSGCFVLGCGSVFCGLFLLAGVFAAVEIVSDLLAGDPNNNLQGDFPWKYLWALFPLPFIFVGAGGLIALWFSRRTLGRSPEQQRAARLVASPPGTVTAPLEDSTLPSAPEQPGSRLAVRLSSGLSAGCQALGLGIMLLVIGSILVPVAWTLFSWFQQGQVNDWPIMSGFFTLFLGLIWVILAVRFIRQLRLSRIRQPVVEISAQPLVPGQRYRFFVQQPGPLQLDWLRLALLCEEKASYRQGTNTRTETRRVGQHELLARQDVSIDRDMPLEIEEDFAVPPDVMHSFKAPHNEILWKLYLEGQVAGGLKFDHAFPVVVSPSPLPGAIP
jgi:hypothetical protein